MVYVPHGYAAEGGAPDEAFSAADLFDDDDGEGDHAEGFGDAVEAGGEELQGGAAYAEGFEDAGCVV